MATLGSVSGIDAVLADPFAGLDNALGTLTVNSLGQMLGQDSPGPLGSMDFTGTGGGAFDFRSVSANGTYPDGTGYMDTGGRGFGGGGGGVGGGGGSYGPDGTFTPSGGGGGGGSYGGSSGPSYSGGAPAPSTTSWSAEQLMNARIIAAAGHDVGASQRDVMIATMTAMGESGLRNLDYGSGSSKGLFQQIPAWGDGRTDPYQAAKMFFTGGSSGQNGLLDIQGRDSMSPGEAAHAVQANSTGTGVYDKFEGDASTILDRGGNFPDLGKLFKGPQVEGPGPAGTQPQVAFTADFIRQKFGFTGDIGGYSYRNIAGTNTLSQHALGLAIDTMVEGDTTLGNKIASYFSNPKIAEAFGIDNIIWNHQITNASRGWEWGAYTGENPHTDHVHIDFHSDYSVDDIKNAIGAGSKAQESEGWRSQVVSQALKWIGSPYKWGGRDYSGVDSSGLVKAVYGHLGVHLPETTFAQAVAGDNVPLDQMRPGDIVAWNEGGGRVMTNTGIFLGGGLFVEASAPGRPVQVSSIDSLSGHAVGVSMTSTARDAFSYRAPPAPSPSHRYDPSYSSHPADATAGTTVSSYGGHTAADPSPHYTGGTYHPPTPAHVAPSAPEHGSHTKHSAGHPGGHEADPDF